MKFTYNNSAKPIQLTMPNLCILHSMQHSYELTFFCFTKKFPPTSQWIVEQNLTISPQAKRKFIHDN